MDITSGSQKRVSRRTYDSEATRYRILQTLDEFTAREGRPPNQREWSVAAGVASMGHLQKYLALLVATGELENRGGARGYVRVRKSESSPT